MIKKRQGGGGGTLKHRRSTEQGVKVCCGDLCRGVTHLWSPVSACGSLVSHAWRCVLQRERRGLPAKIRVELLVRLIGNKQRQDCRLALTGDHVL